MAILGISVPDKGIKAAFFNLSIAGSEDYGFGRK